MRRLKTLTYAKTQKGILKQFERDTKDKNESYLWNNLKPGNKYNLLLSHHYHRKYPNDLTKKDNYFNCEWDNLPSIIQFEISKYSLWIKWRNQENSKIIFKGFSKALAKGLKR